ncbi:MAG TPA: cytochrome b/b6 domain-containing protein [Stellaceae bacterium]|jgi:cytochrome b561|nr:cytochrome b/b6 domain-containing protein [Stellaceae bacterium]
MTEHSAIYDAVIRAVHWLTLLLITGIYAAAWIAHSGLAGDWYQPVMQLHRSLGLSVEALTIVRLAWRTRARVPALPGDLHPLQKLAARANETLLYLLLLAQPVIGLLMTNARGERVSFFLLFDIPPVIGLDRPLGKQLHGFHELTANALLVAIGAHAAAALFHHFIRRDEVLNAMLPVRLRGIGRSLFALRRAREQS